jgi:hypothetical protein
MNLKPQLLAIVTLIGFSSCDMREARLNHFDKDYWIQVAMGTPLPSGMTELTGIGETWQGFDCYFRFRIDSEELRKHLDRNGYEEKEVTDFVRRFTIDPRFAKYFSPAWSPNLELTSKVYVQNPSDYQTFVLLDANSDTVHVWTGGAHSPGPFPSNKEAAQAAPRNR